MARATKIATEVLAITETLSKSVSRMKFAPPTAFVYNPLTYAGAAHAQYITRFARKKKRVIFLGMNPGPWGMAQTGIPFGEISAVRDWMKISAKIEKPRKQHPKRPIQGLDCPRNEVSGARLWGFFREEFETPERFFAEHYVANYCPLVFMEEGGKNRTPDKLAATERQPLERACDRHLLALAEILEPEIIVGVGKFAETKAKKVVGQALGDAVKIHTVLHPSPASPIANRGWAPQAKKQLQAVGVL